MILAEGISSSFYKCLHNFEHLLQVAGCAALDADAYQDLYVLMTEGHIWAVRPVHTMIMLASIAD